MHSYSTCVSETTVFLRSFPKTQTRDDLKTLSSLNINAVQAPVARLKDLNQQKFNGKISIPQVEGSDAKGLFETLFPRENGDFGDDFYETSESKKPRITWTPAPVEGSEESGGSSGSSSGSGDREFSVSVYKGRGWLQKFYNSLGDIERGRAVSSRSESGSVWFYPKVEGDGDVVPDFATSSNAEGAKMARWHHGGKENFGNFCFRNLFTGWRFCLRS